MKAVIVAKTEFNPELMKEAGYVPHYEIGQPEEMFEACEDEGLRTPEGQGMYKFTDEYDAWVKQLPEDADELAEAAGRLCYLSWERPNPKTSKTDGYIANIVEKQHFCYDDQTEVLTMDGWKRWPDVTMQDRLATRTTAGVLAYHRPHALVDEFYTGKMYQVQSSGVDLLVTPNHRMLVCPTTTKQGRKRNERDFELVEACSLDQRSHAYIKTAQWLSGFSPITLNEAKLIGFAVGDGSVPPSGNEVRFHLRRPRKIEWLRKLAADAGWELRENQHSDNYWVNLPHLKFWFRQMFADDKQKQIPPALLMASREVQQGLFDGLIESDGSRGRTGICFDTTSSRLADQVQQLALHVGLASNFGYLIHPEVSMGWNSNYPLRRQHIIRRNLKPEVNKFSGAVGKTSWIEYSGRVYCASVPNGTLYVRRNGIPVWSGNSVLEHATATFLITGVSRALTHELVRHRHFSYSQVSQRYVDHSLSEFTLPPVFNELDEFDRDELRGELAYVNYMAIQAYQAIEEKLLARGFTKKEARGAARAVLPEATKTSILVTGNHRAFREFLSKRLSPAADAEIRELAQGMLEELRKVAPSTYADFEETL